MEKRHFEQGRIWLKAAISVAGEGESKERHAVAIAMLVHSIIKANDALTLKYLNTTARRHEDARRLFEDLIRRNVIKSEYSSYGDIIQQAITNKAKAEYRGGFFSKADFEDMRRKTEKFLALVEKTIG